MIIPKRRNRKFSFDKERAESWHSNGPATTAYFNSLSLLFPEGERFFIRSVRNYQKDISDFSILKEAVDAFVAQEAVHGREHDRFNSLGGSDTGLNYHVDKALGIFLRSLSRSIPRKHQLAITIGLEHITAILAKAVLENPDEILGEKSDEEIKELWKWHAMEEWEHKSVAYDVFRRIEGEKYITRVSNFLMASLAFVIVAEALHLANTAKNGTILNPKEIVRAFSFRFFKPGILRKVLPMWAQYLRPDFHPEAL